jgi:23S rRNA pseudouridine2604 synthase
MSAGPVARPTHGAGGKASGISGRSARLSNRNGASAAGGSDAGEGERLSKRVAQMLGCSRREAEQTIEGGWVRVDGAVVEIPQHRVQAQAVTVDPDASLLALGEVTLILHKPPNVLDSVQDAADPASAAPSASVAHLPCQKRRRHMPSLANTRTLNQVAASGVCHAAATDNLAMA